MSDEFNSRFPRTPSKLVPDSAHYALVTGASSGIGREISLCLAEKGYRLLLIARGLSALEEVKREAEDRWKTQSLLFPCDLAKPGAAGEIHSFVQDQQLEIGLLINNAGFGAYAPFAEAEVQQTVDMIQVNIAALTHLTRLVLPSMIERGAGRILNVASTASFQPGPYMAVYFASKAYVLHFSEALGEELTHTPITVTALCPGPTRTGFINRAEMSDSGLFQQGGVMDARAVAEAGVRAMLRGKRLEVPGLRNKLLAFSVRFSPRRLNTYLAGKLIRNPNAIPR